MTPQIVRLRGPRWLRWFWLVVPLFWLALALTIRNEATWLFFGYWCALAAASVAMQSWFGITLTPQEAVVNSLRRRRIPWSAIQAVTQERFMGGRRVVLWTTRGERIPLRAPVVDFTGIGAIRFERGFHTIGQWWLAHRGWPDWTSPAPSW